MLEKDFEQLLIPGTYGCVSGPVDCVETHISWVFLCGNRVYKIKKPVNFGFLDFSTLEKRRFYCEEELRLNRRFAPDIYLSVASLNRENEHLVLNGQGDIIDYVVVMTRFDNAQRLDRIVARQQLNQKLIDSLAETVASFHETTAERRTATDINGYLESVRSPVQENFTQIRKTMGRDSSIVDLELCNKLDELEKRAEIFFDKAREQFVERNLKGFIRECHGDLHTENIAVINDRPVLFDCIEFNPSFRWIDVMNDLSFLAMDLTRRGQSQAARHLLNRYCERTGDYLGLDVFGFYYAYRAMVRAKVCALRMTQLSAEARETTLSELREYVDLALRHEVRRRGKIYLTCGLSGSGKSTIGAEIAYHRSWIVIRSDVERKRLAGIDVRAKTESSPDRGIYNQDWHTRTYHHLATLTEHVALAGFDVLVDATFLLHWQRKLFTELAMQLETTCTILYFHASDEICRGRIEKRLVEAVDASEADIGVYENQKNKFDAFDAKERTRLIKIDSSSRLDIEKLANDIS